MIVRREHQQGAAPQLRDLRTNPKGKYAVTTAIDGHMAMSYPSKPALYCGESLGRPETV